MTGVAAMALPFAAVFSVSFLLCAGLVRAARWVPRLAGRAGDLFAVQRSHHRLTPRVGGIGVFAALMISIFYVPAALLDAWSSVMIATSVVFFVGLAEDMGWPVSAKLRLLAAAVSTAIAMALIGIWVPRFGIPGLDLAMATGYLGIPLTIFAIAGISHAFNLIDGVNGLAAMTGLIAAVALGWIARMSGQTEMITFAFFIAFALLGFLALNYPSGRIFLGDAGAYSIGFVLCWFGLALMWRNPELSPWAVMLTLFWPIMDTLLAMYRRRRSGKPAMCPDRLHIHQLVMRTFEIAWLGRGRRHLANPLTTIALAPAIMLPALLGVVLWDRPTLALLTFAGLIPIYFAVYFAAVRLVRNGDITRTRRHLRAAEVS